MIGWSLFVAVLAAPPGPGAAAANPDDVPTVSARADRTEARVGDMVSLVVTAVYRRGLVVNLAPRTDLDKFTVLDRSDGDTPRDLGDGHLRREYILHVAAYEPGTHQIPSLEITYLSAGGEVRVVTTAPIDVKIASLLGNADDPKLKDIAPPVRVLEPVVWPIYVAAALAGLLLLILGVLAIRARLARRAAAAAAAAPPRPAHEVALAKLDALRAEQLIERELWKPFHFAVSEIIREYLGARFEFDSLEMTTTELLDALLARGCPGPDRATISEWSGACDLVKFAKYVPTREEAQAVLEGAYRIVDATRARASAAQLPEEVKASAA